MPVSPHALVLDADNTLWDTNATFRRARSAMIQVLQGADPQPGPGPSSGDGPHDAAPSPTDPPGEKAPGEEARPDGEKRLETTDVLYRLSQHLPSSGGEGPDLEQLAQAAAFYMSGLRGGPEAGIQTSRLRWASEQVRAGHQPPGCDRSRARKAAEAFRSALSAPPPLLDGAASLLRGVQAWRTARPDRRTSVLFSEGAPDRLEVAFDAHGIGGGQYFDDIVLREKTPDTFRDVCHAIGNAVDLPEPQAAEIVVIGDSLQRDIRPANATGCTTLYCPGDLWGRETPEEASEQPDYTLGTLDEALRILDL
ncbi:HAD family hydrolase [Salinibacter ruber]|uniref:HAD family hydrolase n=1 Tax=Salinibacter ruber TaxID=146919 RepID=UPI002072F1FE|nr:HAD hydrolase-like protein [Salinibacter ruber]